MTLPINISAVVWFAPRAIWEWEDQPPALPPSPCDQAASSDGEAKGPAGGADTGESPASRRLVFKGYRYETDYSWLFADTPLARPWENKDRDDDAKRKTVPVAPPDAALDAPPAPPHPDDPPRP